MCITDSLCCTPETNTMMKINYTQIKILKDKHTHHTLCYFLMRDKSKYKWWKTRKHSLSLNSLKTCFEVRKADMNWFETENLSARLKTVKKAADMCCDERRCMWRQEESRNAGRWLNTAGKGRPGGLSPAQTPGTCLGQAANGTIWMVLKLGSKHWTESCMFSGTQDGGVKGRLPRGCSQWHQSLATLSEKLGPRDPAGPLPSLRSLQPGTAGFFIYRGESGILNCPGRWRASNPS